MDKIMGIEQTYQFAEKNKSLKKLFIPANYKSTTITTITIATATTVNNNNNKIVTFFFILIIL